MTSSESATHRNAAAQVLREIADSVESGECRGFGIVCSGGSVGYAAAGLHDANTLGLVEGKLWDLRVVS